MFIGSVNKNKIYTEVLFDFQKYNRTDNKENLSIELKSNRTKQNINFSLFD